MVVISIRDTYQERNGDTKNWDDDEERSSQIEEIEMDIMDSIDHTTMLNDNTTPTIAHPATLLTLRSPLSTLSDQNGRPTNNIRGYRIVRKSIGQTQGWR